MATFSLWAASQILYKPTQIYQKPQFAPKLGTTILGISENSKYHSNVCVDIDRRKTWTKCLLQTRCTFICRQVTTIEIQPHPNMQTISNYILLFLTTTFQYSYLAHFGLQHCSSQPPRMRRPDHCRRVLREIVIVLVQILRQPTWEMWYFLASYIYIYIIYI